MLESQNWVRVGYQGLRLQDAWGSGFQARVPLLWVFVAFGAERLRCRGEGRWVKQRMKGESCVV